MTTHLARPLCLVAALSLLGCGTMAHTYTGAEVHLDYRYSSAASTRLNWPPITVESGGHGGRIGVTIHLERDSTMRNTAPAVHPIIVRPAPVPVTVRPVVKCPACSPTLKCGQGGQSGPRRMICEEAT